jgi:hypothetical protein
LPFIVQRWAVRPSPSTPELFAREQPLDLLVSAVPTRQDHEPRAEHAQQQRGVAQVLGLLDLDLGIEPVEEPLDVAPVESLVNAP